MLNPQQKKVAFEIQRNTILSAPPGSGKTKTLVSRAENKLESIPIKKTIALITYTNVAADEIASRLVSQHPVFIGTIHRFCLEYILRPFSWIYDWSKPRVISYNELQDFVDNNQDLDFGNSPIDELNKIKRNLDGTLDTNIEWESNSNLTTVAERYFDYLERINSLDFNGILFRSFKIVSENEYVATSLANKFYEILIDEFQDTNLFQYRIFQLIYNSGPSTFFMVGDEKQKIYRFAGAIENAFELAEKDFFAQHENLFVSYRSTNNIIKAYTSLFDGHPHIKNESAYNKLDIPLYFIETKKTNYDSILYNCVKQLTEKAGIIQSEIAILSTRWRDSLQASRVLRKEFDVVGLGALPHSTRNLNNSTFNLMKSLAQFHYRPSVKYLRAINRAVELHSLENNLNLDEKQLSVLQNKLLFEFQNLYHDQLLDKGLKRISEIFSAIFASEHTTLDDIIERIDKEEISSWTLEKYFKTLSGVDGVTTNTIHQAKGLEYDAVILDQMNENKIPYQKFIERIGTDWIYEPLSLKNIGDGRKLFYVALSRARKILIILHNWKPSMFIEIIKNV